MGRLQHQEHAGLRVGIREDSQSKLKLPVLLGSNRSDILNRQFVTTKNNRIILQLEDRDGRE